MFFPYIFTEWHIVPLLYIQLKLERACSRKTLAEGKASRRLGKYIGGFVCFCESPDIISCISSIRIRFLIREDGARRPPSYLKYALFVLSAFARPTEVCLVLLNKSGKAHHSRTVASVPRPPTTKETVPHRRGEGEAAWTRRGGGASAWKT